MVLDGHIHIDAGPRDPSDLLRRMHAVGITGGVLLSQPPATFLTLAPAPSPSERLDDVFAWCAASADLYPFYWIDPIEADALGQVSMAVERGIAGFKVICDRFYPGDERAMPVYRAIARAGRPILFHSGILWDGKPSSRYNRPAEFESLLQVEGLRFALAHISWPWCDELIAVYGKVLNAFTRHSDLSVEMFVDITPGTPPIYRREALTKLFTVGYDINHNVIFGSDATANAYNGEWVRKWLDCDHEILTGLGLDSPTLDAVAGGNLRRFLTGSPPPVSRALPQAGQ